jgi:cytochrome P450
LLARTEREVDLVQELALPVPSTVLSWILGVRAEDRAFFNTAAERLMNIQDAGDPQALARAVEAATGLREYIGELADERAARTDPGDDVLGRLVAAVRDGTIDRHDLANTGLVLVVAGHDTTASMTALGTLTLLRHPDQLAELRADPRLLPDAIEELLRWLTVVQLIILRVATEDIEVGGQVIPAGEGIVPLNLAANRDDSHYPHAGLFDIHRRARDHFAFGYGVHRCLGQPLARVELSVIFETLLRRLPGLALAVPAGEVPFKPFSQIAGLSGLPVTY